MEAYLSSSLDALVLLRGLEQKARIMTGYCIALDESPARVSSKRLSLCLWKTIEGTPIRATISRHDKRTLVASIENEQGLGNATIKRRLAALLLPVVTEYVGALDSVLPAEDRVRIVFGDATDKRPQRKRCVLFAEDAAKFLTSTDRPSAASRVMVDESSQTGLRYKRQRHLANRAS